MHFDNRRDPSHQPSHDQMHATCILIYIISFVKLLQTQLNLHTAAQSESHTTRVQWVCSEAENSAI